MNISLLHMLPCREEKYRERGRGRDWRRGREWDGDKERRERRPRGGGGDNGYESQSARSRRSDWERETPRSELGDATPNPRLTGAQFKARSNYRCKARLNLKFEGLRTRVV